MTWPSKCIKTTSQCLTLQVGPGDQLCWNEEGGHLHHQLCVGQPPPGLQSVSAQHGQCLRHEHPTVWSKTGKQDVPKAPSLVAPTSATVEHLWKPGTREPHVLVHHSSGLTLCRNSVKHKQCYNTVTNNVITLL